eukprot:4477872-Prymnesium_polylepis.1
MRRQRPARLGPAKRHCTQSAYMSRSAVSLRARSKFVPKRRAPARYLLHTGWARARPRGAISGFTTAQNAETARGSDGSRPGPSSVSRVFFPSSVFRVPSTRDPGPELACPT